MYYDFMDEAIDNEPLENDGGRFSVMLHHTSFAYKPGGKEVASMIKGFKTQRITVNQLAYLLACGRTCRSGILENGGKAENWQFQQCFFVDVDGTKTVPEALKICRKLDLIPNIVYPSFRYTPDNQRFRIVFVASEIIRDGALRDRVQQRLIEIFDSDPKTKDRARIFFGGETYFWVDDTARMDVAALFRQEWGVSGLQSNPFVSAGILQIIRSGDAMGLRRELEHRRLLPPSGELPALRAFADYLRSLDMRLLFGVEKGCCCIFHNDQQPSALIYRGASGDWLYFCHSAHCLHNGHAMNLIQVIQACMRTDKMETYTFLLKSFNVKLMEKDAAVSAGKA